MPLLDRQPVDVLRRVGATAQKAAMEQWQRGEIVTSTNGITSHGGDKPVAVRVLSSGDAVLGVSYGVKHFAVPAVAVPSTPVDDTPKIDNTHQSDGSKEATAAVSLTASSSSFLPPGETSSSLVLADPSHLSPSGLFGKWVPTAADVTPISSSTTTILPNLRDLSLRGRACYRDQAEITARFLYTGEGRRALGDFDLVDICLPASKALDLYTRSSSSSSSSLSSLSPSSPLSPSSSPPPFSSSSSSLPLKSPLEEALELLHGPSLGHWGHERHPVLLHGESLSASSTGAFTIVNTPNATLTRTNAFSGPRRRPLLASSLWRLARVRLLEGGIAAARELAGRANHTRKGKEIEKGGGIGDEKNNSSSGATTGIGGGGSVVSHSSDKAALANPPLEAFVFWFEATFQQPAVDELSSQDLQQHHEQSSAAADVPPRHLQIRPILRFAPLNKVHSVAPAGTYTTSFVPGQKIESRRAGGLWAPCDVVSADRFALCVRVRRPSKGVDSSALVPTAFAQFDKNAKPMKAAPVGGLSADAQKKASNVYAKRYGGGGGGSQASTKSPGGKLHDDSEMAMSSPASAHLQKAEMRKRASSAKPRPSKEEVVNTASSDTAAVVHSYSASATPVETSTPGGVSSVTSTIPSNEIVLGSAADGGGGGVPMSRRDRVAAAARGGGSSAVSPTHTDVTSHTVVSVPASPVDSTLLQHVPNAEENAWIATTVSPEAHLETIPRHFWHLFVARAGLFCSETLLVQDASSFVQDAFPSSKERGRAKVATRFGEQSDKAASSSLSSSSSASRSQGTKQGKGGLVLAVSSLDLEIAKKRAKRVS